MLQVPQRRLRKSLGVLVPLLAVAWAGRAAAGSAPAGSAFRYSSRTPRPQIYEVESHTGGLHRGGDVWMHMDNTNFSPGNNWFNQGLNQDPSAQWPGPSGVEYLEFSSLWIAGQDIVAGRRVDQEDEIRGALADFARTRHAYDGIPAGARGVDDDGDGRTDEDYLNGLDDDADGRVDEDYAAVSPDMYATEMSDFTPEAIGDALDSDRHVPFGLRVRRTSYAWSTPGSRNFVGIHYEVTNVTRSIKGGVGQRIDSLYLGMYWRPVAGRRDASGLGSDDRVGRARVRYDGKSPAYELNRDLHSVRDDHNLDIFWCADNDGDSGAVAGAGAYVLLGATRFPRLGLKRDPSFEEMSRDDYGIAPRMVEPHAYHVYSPELPFEQGGRPVTDRERYDAMTIPDPPDKAPPDQPGSYRALFSVGPYVSLEPDSAVELDVAFCVGKAGYAPGTPWPRDASDLDGFRARFGDLVPFDPQDLAPHTLTRSCLEAWTCWNGGWQRNSHFDELTRYEFPFSQDNVCSPADCVDNYRPETPIGLSGRESCLLAPLGSLPGDEPFYYDCHDVCSATDINKRRLSATHCTWFDLDCEGSTGACVGPLDPRPATDHILWYSVPPPVAPRVKLVPGNRQVEIRWDDLSENAPNGGSNFPSVTGYRLYRAIGWKRDPATGGAGPANDLWQLIGRWGKYGEEVDPIRNIRNASVSEDSIDRTAPCATGPCQTHPVGYYHYIDHQVVNGFRYFYAVAAYLDVPNPDYFTTQQQAVVPLESPPGDPDSALTVGTTDCLGDARHIKVVPNPYRFHAAWDLRPSSADPTGTHVNFNHLPCGPFQLRIFTVAGDLVRSFDQRDARGTGTLEWDLVTRNGQNVQSGIFVYSITSSRGASVGRLTLIR